ncbi:MAG: Txe/YoeB family addiction module toxin [Ignavibacteria bacterium]|nr:Txe/YoeB family addiction module toxin [Ignavibacteria bacterium]
MRTIVFETAGIEQYNWWAVHNKKTFVKIAKLILEASRTPFSGTGSPEALKHDLKGFWSRRINEEHRLVYKVTEKSIIIISCKYHY